MKEEQTLEEFLLKRNDNCALLLGIATALIMTKIINEDDRNWWMNAIEEVCYKDNPVPPLHKSSRWKPEWNKDPE